MDPAAACPAKIGIFGMLVRVLWFCVKPPVPWIDGCYFSAVPGSPLMDS